MKHIISKRLISLFLSVILGVSLVVPVMAEVATFSIASPILSESVAPETHPIRVTGGSGKATPTNLSGGWPGVATPTDLQGGWNEALYNRSGLSIFDATTNQLVNRIYMDVGNTAVLAIKENFNNPVSDIENIEFSFTLDSKPFDATNYFNVEFNKEKQIVTVMPKMPLPTFNEDNTVKGFRLAMKITRPGGIVETVYLYLLKNPVAINVVVDSKDSIFLQGVNYTLELNPNLPFKGTVQALMLNENAPAQNITASINEADNAINVSVAQDCPLGFYRLRLTGEGNMEYYFTDALIYVSDLVLYDVNSSCKAGEVTYDIPFDSDEKTYVLGDKNGIFPKDTITKISVSPSAILNMSGASDAKGNGITVSPNGETGTEEIMVTATLKDGTIRNGVFKANCYVREPLMLLERKNPTDKPTELNTATVEEKHDLLLYIDGKCAVEHPDLYRNITIDVSAPIPGLTLTKDDAKAMVSIIAHEIMQKAISIPLSYEKFDSVLNTWTKKNGSLNYDLSVRPLKNYSGDLCLNNNGTYNSISWGHKWKLGETVNVTACERLGNGTYIPIRENLDLTFRLEDDAIATELNIDEYLTIKPVPNAINTFALICKKLPAVMKSNYNYIVAQSENPKYWYVSSASFLKDYCYNVQLLLDGNFTYSNEIVPLYVGAATKLTLQNNQPNGNFDVSTISREEVRVYKSVDDHNQRKEETTKYFTIEKLQGNEYGYNITPNADCPSYEMVVFLDAENATSYISTQKRIQSEKVFLVNSKGKVANEIAQKYGETAQSYYFSDSKGTVTEDRIENISVTGVDCGIDIFKNYFSVYQKPNIPLSQTAKITLTMKDTTVHTFTVPCKNIGAGNLVNKNSINIDNYLFTIGKPETFYCSNYSLDINNTIITIKNQESIPSYIDMKTNGNSVTVTFTRIPQPTEITRISLSAEDKVGRNWISFDYIVNASNFISGDVPRIVPVIDNEIGATNRSILLTEPTEFTVLMPSNKKVSNIELKARHCSNRVIIKNISYNKFLVSPNIDSPDSIVLYAEITYEDGSGDYCEAYLETKNQTLLNDTLPNRKCLSFAKNNYNGRLQAVSQLDNWFPETLYLACAKDEYNYDIMPCDDANIKSIEALSSNEAVLKATVEKEMNSLGYVVKYTIDHNVPFDTAIVLTAKITYNNGDIRKAYAVLNPQASDGWITPTVDVPTQSELELSGTTLQQYLNKADVKPFSDIHLKEDTYIGDLVLNKPLNIIGVSQTQSVIKGSILYKWQTDLRSFSIEGSNRKGVGIASSYKTVAISEVGISDFDIGIKLQNIPGGTIYKLNVSNCRIGIISTSTTYNTHVRNCDIGVQGSCCGSTLENNKIAQQILPRTIDNNTYIQCQTNKFINNEINIDNQNVETTMSAEQNYFSKTKNADGTLLKEPINYPYAASIKGKVKVEPYFLDEAMTKLSIVLPPQDSSGTVDLKPTNTVTVKNEDGTTTEKKEATVTIDNPTGDAKINDAVFKAAGNASASTDETKKVDNLVFEVKSEKAETEIKWSFPAEELKNNYDKPEGEQIKAPSLSVKFDFDQLAPEQEEKLTAEEVLAKNSIKEIIEETKKLQPGKESILYQSISFSHSGRLPAPATITIKKNAALSRPGALDVLRIYWFNPAKGALEAMLDELDSDGDKDFKEYLPIKDNKDEGTISFVITHCSEYIVAAESSKETAIINPDTTAVFDITAIKMTKPIDELKISTDKEFVSNIKLGSTVGNILSCLNPANALTAKKDGVALSATDTISTGTRIVYEVGANPNPTERAHITAVIYGDASGDGAVDVADLIIIQGRILSGTKTVDPKNALDVAANIVDSAALTLDVGDLLSVRAHLLKANLIDQNL